MTLSSRDPARPAVSLAPGETVVHVATAGQGGYYAVLTSTNRYVLFCAVNVVG